MRKYTEITKTEFNVVYNSHLPNKWIKFAYKYFSKTTEKKDMALKNNLVFIMLGLFFIGFFSTAFHLNTLVGLATIPYAIILSVLVLYLFSAVILNNLRINKIRKILKITKKEYNILVSKFYNE